VKHLLLIALASCALPVVSAGNYLPAGDLQPGDFHASVSLEVGRVLAGPSDVNDLPSTPLPAQQWEVTTWVGSDLSLRYQLTRRITLEGQLKLTNPITPFVPEIVGGAVGARFRLLEHQPEGGWAAEIGARFVGISAQQNLSQTSLGTSQTDSWNYRAGGIEVPLVVTYRMNSLVSVTGSPFARIYYIRAWHDSLSSEGIASQKALFWTPILSAGLAGSFAFDLGPLELAPGLAMELATKPGPGTPTHVLFEPGVSVGTRF
jgi:hypothetical protein